MKILGYASENNVPIHMVDKGNLSNELAVINVADQVKQEVRSAVNSGKIVIIPEHEISINQWSGVGYMVLDPDTCACGYMISGGMAGGALTWYEVLGAVYLNVREGFKVMLACMALLAICPALLPLFYVLACIGAFTAGWSIGTHIYNCITTGDVREYQEAMIEIASFCLLLGIGEGLKNAAKNPETAVKAEGEAAEACKEGTCFIAGTLISTSTGLVPIENIKAGDVVYSFDEKTQEISKQVVEETFVRESNELVHITVGDETITTTPEHPFYVPQKGFVNAINLRAGDTLCTVNGEYVILEQIQHEILETPIKVYNFRVANSHTYFVGNTCIGVHNAYCGPNDALQNQGKVKGDVEGAPDVDAGKQGKHVPGHNNYNPSKSTWANGNNGVSETQKAWLNGTQLPDGTKVWETGNIVGTNGETGVRVHIDGNGNIHGYPVFTNQYLP